MQKYNGIVRALNGNVVPNASVLVTQNGVPATIYSNEGSTEKANPLTTDMFGDFNFYAKNGKYTLTATGTGINTKILTDVELYDADAPSLLDPDYGGIGDGVTDDTQAVNDIKAQPWYFTPKSTGTYKTTLAYNKTGPFHYGPGQVETTEGKRANIVVNIDTPPSSIGSGGILTMFNSDHKSPLRLQAAVTGASTSGTPASAYTAYDEIVPIFMQGYYSSGYDNPSGTGRTGWHMQRVKVSHYGKGDAGCYNAEVFMGADDTDITGTVVGKPAGILWNGQAKAGVNNVYLNPIELNCVDDGYDVLAIGQVFNFFRDNNVESLGQMWIGSRMQAKGPEFSNSAFQAVDFWQNGLDTTCGDPNMKALVMRADQSIHFDGDASSMPLVSSYKRYADTFGNTRMYFKSLTSTLHIEVSGGQAIQINAGAIAIRKFMSSDAFINVLTGKGYQVDNLTVVKDRKSGWALPTGTATRTAFDTTTVTLPLLAERVKALIDDLHSTAGHGLIGA